MKMRGFLGTRAAAGWRGWWWACCVALAVAAHLYVGAVIPRLQSPDEPDHLRRAHMVSHGDWALFESPELRMSGGLTDSGFNAYVTSYHRLSAGGPEDRQLSQADVERLARMPWSGDRSTFVPVPGTGYYFPAIYIPQALGLRLGELAGMTVEASYRLAQTAAFLCSLALVMLAWRHWRMPPAAGALLLLPLSMLQSVSTSIDGLANGLVILVVSLFLEQWQKPTLRGPWMPVLCLCIFIIVTCRYHMAGLLCLPLLLAWRFRSWKMVALGCVTVAATLGWTLWAMQATLDTRANSTVSAATVLLHYLHAPLAFVEVFFRTWSDPELPTLYYESFLGRLGALDVRYGERQYLAMATLLLIAVAASVDWRSLGRAWPQRAALLFCGLVAIPLAFLAMLLTWTPHPAWVIYGVQGRYFMGPALVVAYALAAGSADTPRRSPLTVVGWASALALGVFSVATIPGLMFERFYLH